MVGKPIRSLANDLRFGLDKELEVVDMLKLNFCDLYNEDDIKNTKDLYQDEYYPYDYEGTSRGTCFEMKSRRVKKHQYSTTIIPVHKVRKTDKKQIFIFNFTDNCSYIEYDQELFRTFQQRDITTERFGTIDKPKPHYLIPVKLLIDLVNVYKLE